MQIRTLLLDVDGTLLDSNDAHAESWIQIFLDFGFTTTFARVRELIGKGGDKLIPEVTGVAAGSTLGKEMTQKRSALFKKEYLPSLRPQPGVRELLLALRHLHFVVATSSDEDQIRDLLRAAKIDDLIETKTTADDADHSKPDPDIVVSAMKKALCEPHATMMLGDTPYDVEAASKAGVGIIALRCGGWDDEALRGAAAIYDTPQDLLTHLANSPLRSS